VTIDGVDKIELGYVVGDVGIDRFARAVMGGELVCGTEADGGGLGILNNRLVHCPIVGLGLLPPDQ
jgi:hypothetical protein